MKKNKFDVLLLAGLTSNLFYSIAYPIIYLTIIKDINSNLMSFCNLINCIFTIIITKAWLNKSKSLYKSFGLMLGLEGLFYTILTTLYLTGYASNTIYYFIDVILCATITRNIICGGTRLKALRYNGEDREIFDNRNNVYCNIASVIGYSFSSIYTLNIKVAFILMLMGIIVDNIFYYYVYHEQNIKKLNE